MAFLGCHLFRVPNPGQNAGALVDNFKDKEWSAQSQALEAPAEGLEIPPYRYEQAELQVARQLAQP
ncbi:hypothetical protein [Bradyrhizobium sp. USDA 4454]